MQSTTRWFLNEGPMSSRVWGSRHLRPKTSVSADALPQVIDFVEGQGRLDQFNAGC